MNVSEISYTMYKHVIISLVFFFSITISLWAQDKKEGSSLLHNGDEQGMEAYENLQLDQDRHSVKKAFSGWWKNSMENRNERMEWYNDAKFGCFIHWGVYSVPAGIWKGKKMGGYTEHLMRQAKIPLKTYKDELVATFNPTEFDAREWMQNAANASMKYFIITSKHHDGYALFPSEAYPYDIRQSLFDRDPMKELRNAAKEFGIKFGFYYSHAFDWEHPDAPGNDWDYDNPGGDKLLHGKDWWLNYPEFLPHAEKYVKEKSIPQIVELIKNYEPDILWFDTPHKLPLYLNISILEAIRKNDPENKIVVNGRLARYANYNFGDYINTGDRSSFFYPVNDYWESIPTTNESYGYSLVDKSHKSPAYFIRLLSDAVSKGGNILMNVGPMGNGKWDEKDVAIFNEVGKWMEANGNAIYGNKKTDLPIQQWGVTTLKDDTIFLHVHKWPETENLIVGGLTSEIKNIWLLADKQKKSLKYKHLNSKDFSIKLPLSAPDTINTVIALQVEKWKPSYPVSLLNGNQTNLLYAFDAQLSGKGFGYGDGKKVGKMHRYYVSGWKNNSQNISWKVRTLENVQFDIYLEYNTKTKDDSGTISVNIDENTFDVAYTPITENQGVNRLFIGRIKPNKKDFSITLKGKDKKGEEYLRPTILYLQPVK